MQGLHLSQLCINTVYSLYYCIFVYFIVIATALQCCMLQLAEAADLNFIFRAASTLKEIRLRLLNPL